MYQVTGTAQVPLNTIYQLGAGCGRVGITER